MPVKIDGIYEEVREDKELTFEKCVKNFSIEYGKKAKPNCIF